MAEKEVKWSSHNRLSCSDCLPANVILCTPEGTIIAQITAATRVKNCGRIVRYEYTITYDTLDLPVGLLVLACADISNVFCKGCLTSWIEEQLAISTQGRDIPHGIYTPTPIIMLNLDDANAAETQWFEIGKGSTVPLIHVSGSVNVDPTAAGLVQLGLNVPVPSAFTADEQANGTAFASGVDGQGAAIYADAINNNRVILQFIAVNLTLQTMFYEYTYRVL